MMIVLNILYVGFLFSVFLGILFLPIGLVVFGIRRWYATHSLRKLPWRRRRALLGLALLWTSIFSRLSRWKKIMGMTVVLLLLLAWFLGWLYASLYEDTSEAMTMGNLRAGRFGWLMDGCPEQPDVTKYFGEGTFSTNYVYKAPLVVNDRTYCGLFAEKNIENSGTYVITTTGDILVIEDKGQVRLLERDHRP
jgi:hypothetical protein